jgi:hypothetical protein
MSELFHDCYTEDGLAEETGKTPDTLRRWRRQRIGPPFIKIGREIYYRKEAVKRWRDSLETETRAA